MWSSSDLEQMKRHFEVKMGGAAQDRGGPVGQAEWKAFRWFRSAYGDEETGRIRKHYRGSGKPGGFPGLGGEGQELWMSNPGLAR